MSNAKKIGLIIALIIPILGLGLLTYYHHWRLQRGIIVTLPIVGFDPRDLLSGHYLTYRLDVNANSPCQKSTTPRQPAYLCLYRGNPYWPAQVVLSPMDVKRYACDLYIQGYCQYNSFMAGVEKFYIPEQQAPALEQQVRNKKGAIVLGVDQKGNAVVNDLLIEGMPWQEWLKNTSP